MSSNSVSQEGTADVNDEESACEIIPDIASAFTYASYQNAVPVIRSITIENGTDRHLNSVRLELTSTPAFLRPKSWTIDALAPSDRLELSDRKIELDAGYLAGLNEAERGEIQLTLRTETEVFAEQRHTVRLLARDEWGGVNDMAQLLPAFVMPNDPAISAILRKSAESLAKHGHPSGMDGYQSEKPQRAFMLAAAIYSAITGLGLHYAEPPASFEKRGQKIRRPGTIAETHLATCLDSTVLFCAALEAAGLYPTVLMFQGHSIVGVWLVKKTFANTIEYDPIEVRKALAAREFIIFETTGVTHRPAMTFDAAQRDAARRLSDDEAQDFVASIDIRRARSGGINPLASHDPVRRQGSDEEPESVEALPLPAEPALDEMPTEIAEEKPTTASGRIDRWQRKLLDLTLRNRLLNFPDTKKTIPFLCTDVGYLEDRLADGASIRVISLPEQNPIGERDANLFREMQGHDIQRNFAAEALKRDELPSRLEAKEFQARLINLHRQVRNDFAEGGANTLFMAVGFLRWKKKPEDQKTYRAPLLLVPVRLERRSASSTFTLRFHEDEPRFNATLLQFLEREFELKLPQFAGDLPLDDSGVDVPLILSLMRKAVRDVPGMEVVDETALSTFSFAKFLMWKDLVERTDALRNNRVVRHLIDTPARAFHQSEQNGSFPEETELDKVYAPSDIISLLPADSSQTAASLAAAEGKDFVIIGPPGTGKSQTIANMIANCLAKGKTVLFVAEKTAALDVVYRRLREHGLGDQCVELHSSKTERKHFLGQLKSAWEQGGAGNTAEWVSLNDRLKIERDKLNAYVEALHKQYPNGWTPYRALGIALKARDVIAPEFSWKGQDVHDAQTLQNLEDIAVQAGVVFASIERNPALDFVDISEWTSRWQEKLLNAGQSLKQAIEKQDHAQSTFLSVLGLGANKVSAGEERSALEKLASALTQSEGRDISICFDRDFAKLKPALGELANSINRYRAAEQKLTASYARQVVKDIDASALQREWAQAAASLWPKSLLRKRKIRKHLGGFAGEGRGDPEIDLSLMRVMKECLSAIDANPITSKPFAKAGLDANVEVAAEILDLAAGLRSALRLPGRSPDEIRALLHAIAPGLDGALDADRPRQAAAQYMAAVKAKEVAQTQFEEASGKIIPNAHDHEALTLMLSELANASHQLRDWASWCAVKRQASFNGMSPLIEAMETGRTAPDETRSIFRLAYARWWLPKVLDSDPVLRSFRRFQHENAIKEFREIDDLVRAQASQRVMSAMAHNLPSVTSVPRNSELGLLRHQMELQRPSKSIRDIIGNMPEAFPKLAPCMLMSPLSIAQYLPANQALFDVVIFDEASQITTWDAVGAIARARQTVIVGDPKQLPPTNFFGRNEEDEEIAEHEKDLESILDEAKASGLPLRDLRWHYRSRSESLIAFSNYMYYGNRLITFPSPLVDDNAVQLRKIPDGVYDRGKSRTNRKEAEAVATEAVKRMKSWLRLPETERPTLGVITFNIQQQQLILDFLDLARRNDPELEWFFAEDRFEPTIVKNLENVQGDERDVVLFSITFWKDIAGKTSMNFGALNGDGGGRRLNVAVTRARQEMIVFSGFTADQIDTSRTKAVGVHQLKTFLDFAERGAASLAQQNSDSLGELESPFEEAVAEQLEARGWLIVPQVGISGFRIDIGIKHPDLAGAYLAGVECDGATYHSSATARDRDKVREQVLVGLGWNIVRVWSTDWWFDAEGCGVRLHESLEKLLEEDRERRAKEAELGLQQHDNQKVEAGEDLQRLFSSESEAELLESRANVEIVKPTPAIAESVATSAAENNVDVDPDRPYYKATDLSVFNAEPEQFYEFSYRKTLKDMVAAVVSQEGPLLADVLAQRIARAHGWLRTGSRIREKIDAHLRNFDKTTESSGVFIWEQGSLASVMPYRVHANDDSRRSIVEVPIAELTSLIIENPDLFDQDDPARDLARLMGVERLAATSRGRLEEALVKAREHLDAQSNGVRT